MIYQQVVPAGFGWIGRVWGLGMSGYPLDAPRERQNEEERSEPSVPVHHSSELPDRERPPISRLSTRGAGRDQPDEIVDDKARLSDTERAMLMGGACAKAYGWSPKKA